MLALQLVAQVSCVQVIRLPIDPTGHMWQMEERLALVASLVQQSAPPLVLLGYLTR